MGEWCMGLLLSPLPFISQSLASSNHPGQEKRALFGQTSKAQPPMVAPSAW